MQKMIAQSPKPELRLLAYQIFIPPTRNPTERDRHLARAAAMVSNRLSREPEPIDLVVLPELSSIEYSREAFEALHVLAEPLDGLSFKTWRAVAERFGVTIAYGLPVFTDGLLQITQVVVGPDGERRGAYAKLHTAQFGASMEKEFFSSGDHIFVFDVAGFRVAPIICYDIRIPELSRTLCVDHGVDLLLHCGAYARDLTYFSWHHFVITRALENQVYVLSVNRAGQDFGGSIFCPPWIDQTQSPHHFGDGEVIETLTVTRSAIEAARRTYPFLADRLADYSNLPFQLG
ncbi:carbon-nitrogen hydrolase family protein [Mesorhizobium sp. M0563]|uniref:carbon-nitrogen hydrolase family protein n=1 Tax=Mesorhizobium sp. M0563 TaxID=2956959 RepID=UPI00333A37C4